MNCAFVFIKPHANTEAAQALVKKTFEERKIEIVSEGEINGPDIDKNGFIDQHYYAIASKALIIPPKDLPVPADKFEAHFGESWESALEKGLVKSAKEAKEYMGVDDQGLEGEWRKIKKDLIKFGGGFYCGKLKKPEGAERDTEYIYTFNAFFMSMRSAFVQPEASVHYYTVQFKKEDCSWSDFRGKVLGPTNPADAPADSLRGLIMAQYKDLGLESEPNTGNNGVHASASPFEGLAERTNWLKVKIEDDPFGKLLLEAGVSEETIKAWSVDPQVPNVGSLFDSMEDLDWDACVEKAVKINTP